MQRNIAGLVTDGSVRDTDELIGYGFPVFSFSTTAKQVSQIVKFSVVVKIEIIFETKVG